MTATKPQLPNHTWAQEWGLSEGALGCLGTETRSGSKWGVHTVQGRVEKSGAGHYGDVWGFGKLADVCLGLGLFPFLWRLPPPQARVCGQWDGFLFSHMGGALAFPYLK